MPARPLTSSITDAKARKFVSEAAERETLWCDRVTGFHLIRLKKGGSWRYRYQDDTGKRRVATVGKFPALKPEIAAQRALEWRTDDVDVLADKAKRKDDAEREAALAASRTIKAYLEGAYAKHQARKKAGDATLSIIRRNFADWLDRDMATITRSDVRAWQERREADGLAYTTMQRAYGALATMFRHAQEQDPPMLETNPLDRVYLESKSHDEQERDHEKESIARRRVLSDAEIQGLHRGLAEFSEQARQKRRNTRAHGKAHLPDLDTVEYPHWFVPFCYVSLYLGLRPGDVYSLTWIELNINFGRVNKIPEKTRHHRDPARIIMDMPDDLRTIMDAWWRQQGKPSQGLVFPSPVTGGRLDRQAHSRAWASVRELGGLSDDLVFYSLRHHFISTLVAAGVPLFVVAKLAGHKSAEMIEKHYGHLVPDAAADAMAVFSKSVERRASA